MPSVKSLGLHQTVCRYLHFPPPLDFQGPNVIPADITFVVQEKLHPRFKRANDDLAYMATIPLGKVKSQAWGMEPAPAYVCPLGLPPQLRVPIPPSQALIGCTVEVRTLDGRLLNIPINDIVE